MVTRHALVDVHGVVTGVVLWDSETQWTPPDGETVMALSDDSPVSPGWTRTATGWVPALDSIQRISPHAAAQQVVNAQADPNTSNPARSDLLNAIALLLSDSRKDR